MKPGAGMSTTTVRSFRAAAKKIAVAARSLRDDFGWRLRVIGEEIMTDVKTSTPGHGVPVDKGALRSSGRVEGPTGTSEKPQVELSFGGSSAPYALIQHEVTTFHHTVGEPRYLVRGLERWHPDTSPAFVMLRRKAKEALAQEPGWSEPKGA